MKNMFRKKIKFKKYSISVIAVLAALSIVLALSSIVIPKIMAGDTIVSDLHIQAESEGNIISLHITDENETDTKVVVPLPDSVTYKLNQTSNIGVTEDTVNHQLVIDWVDGQSKDVKLQLEAQKSGVYDFVVQTVRDNQPVSSAVSTVEIYTELHEASSSNTIPESNDKSEKQINNVNNVKESGSDGTVNWYLDDSGTLTFGSGEFSQDRSSHAIWGAFSSEIRKIIFSAPAKAPIDSSSFFSRMKELEEFENLNLLDTSAVTNMSYMFEENSVKHLDLSAFDTRNVTNMNAMFSGSYGITELDLSSFNTNKVTDMSNMFEADHDVKKINMSSFDTSNVTKMSQMFWGCNALDNLDLSSFNTSKVLNFNSMFLSNSSLHELDLSKFDIGNNANINQMFYGCNSLWKIILGNNIESLLDTELPTLSKTNSYTGNWQNVGDGTPQTPNGEYVFSSTDLMSNYHGKEMVDTYVWQPRKSPIVSQEITATNDNSDSNTIVGDSINFKINFLNTVTGSQMLNTTQTITIPADLLLVKDSVEVLDMDGNNVQDFNFSYKDDGEGETDIIIDGEALNLIGNRNLTVKFQVKPQKAGNYLTKSVINYTNDFGSPQPSSNASTNLTVDSINPESNNFELKPEDTTKFDANNTNFPSLTTLTKGEKTPMIYKVSNTKAPRDETLTQFDMWLTDVNWKNDFEIDKSSFYIKQSTTSDWEKVEESKIDDTTSIGDNPSYTIKDLDLTLAKGETIEIKFSITAKSTMAIKKNAIAAQGTIKESGSLSSLNSLVVKSGELRFETVPDIMSFEDSKISNRTVESSRKDKDWKITVEDTRLEKKPWRVTTKLLTPFKDTTGADLQSDILLFRKAGQEDQWINNTSETDVYDGTSTKEDYYAVSWSSNEGPLIQVAPGTVKVGQYKGVMQWSLIDAPA